MSGQQPKGLFGRMFQRNETPASDDADSAAAEPSDNTAAPADEDTEQKGGWFQRLTSGLSKTSSRLTDSITGIFAKRRLDADTLQDLEDVLIQADLGVETSLRIVDAVKSGKYDSGISPEAVREILANEISATLAPVAQPLNVSTGHKPHVVLVVGVNGAGKTTTIGKLAAQYVRDGKSVV
ncbi:MAG: signal recognition particle receptor subunit alpha, partial [Pseudomonadota bacterium]